MAMKLYFVTEQISLAPHIMLIEGGFDFELIKVNLTTMCASNGDNFLNINPNGYVPALVLENGKTIIEVPAMLQYLADLKPELNLAPRHGEWMRVEMWEAFDFFSTEILAYCLPIFMPHIADEIKNELVEKMKKRLDFIEFKIKDRIYILGDHFTAVDAFAFPILSWMPRFSIDLHQWPSIHKLMLLLRDRDSILKAQQVEMDYPIF